jgi:hypothetical protein
MKAELEALRLERDRIQDHLSDLARRHARLRKAVEEAKRCLLPGERAYEVLLAALAEEGE